MERSDEIGPLTFAAKRLAHGCHFLLSNKISSSLDNHDSAGHQEEVKDSTWRRSGRASC